MGLSNQRRRSAGFQACCIAGFQTCRTCELHDTARMFLPCPRQAERQLNHTPPPRIPLSPNSMSNSHEQRSHAYPLTPTTNFPHSPTAQRRDIAYTFREIRSLFLRRAMESMLSNRGTISVCKVGFAGPRNVRGTVWPFWHQPDGWIQMEEAVYQRRSERSQRPFATSPPFAQSDQPPLGEMDSPVAEATSHLGRTQDFGMAERRVSSNWFAIGTNDCHLPANHEADEGSTPSTSGSVDKSPAADAGQARQSRLDSRLQRVVSSRKRAASRTIDHTRFVQSLRLGDSGADEPTMEADAGGHETSVSTLWAAGSHSRGQRNALWLHRASGAVAVERMVDELGNTGGVYRPWTPGTKWRPPHYGQFGRCNSGCGTVYGGHRSVVCPSAGGALIRLLGS